MNTPDVSIKVTGDIPSVRALSCEIQLGINQIPVAYVGIDPTGTDLITNMDSYRRKACVITVDVKGEKLLFDCLFDGLSYSMSPGGMSYTGIFKSKFQTWLEIYPFAPGVSPAGINPFIRTNWISLPGENAVKAELQSLIMSIAPTGLSDIPLAQCLVQMFGNIIKAQIQKTNVTADTRSVSSGLISNILAQMTSGANNPNYAKALTAASNLTSDIDTNAVNGLSIGLDQMAVLKFMMDTFLSATTEQDLWSALVHAMSVLGAVIVPAFNKVYIVPSCYFLKPSSSRKIPGKTERINSINFASPGYFDNISVSDNGYKDISAVALMAALKVDSAGLDISTPAGCPLSAVGMAYCTSAFYGSYPDITSSANMEKIHGGLVVKQASYIASLYANYPPSMSARPASTLSKESGEMVASYGEEQGMAEGEVAVDKAATATTPTEATRNMLNNLAEAEFLNLKYADRTGSINMLFSSKWVPGTTGTAFSRYPLPNGIFTDFYVTQVRHVFNSGSALTQISFAGARTGKEPAGLDEFKLFGYTPATMLSVQQQYVSDIIT